MALLSINVFQHLWPFVISGVSSWFIVAKFLSWYRLRHIPGPWLAGFSYLWMLIKISGGSQQNTEYRRLSTRYGSLVRIAPNYVATSDPDLLREITGARSTSKRDDWYKRSRIDPHTEIMISTTDTAKHDTLKAKSAAGYSGREATNMEEIISSQVDSYVRLIREKYVSKGSMVRPLDFALTTSFFTLDVISAVAFGKPFGFLETNEDLYDLIATIRDRWRIAALASDIPWIGSIVYTPVFLKLFAPQYGDKAGVGRMLTVTRDSVDARYRDGDKDQNDMMASWMRHGMTREEARSEGPFLVLAGSDTVASVVRGTMLNILSNGPLYAKLKQVIATCVSGGQVSNPITLEEARRIPYLQALIYEGIRYRSPTNALFFKTSPDGGLDIQGKHIPAGTAIGMNMASLLASKDLFGEDADVFRPERFLEVSDSDRIEMERNVELVFGHGRWMCSGKTVAFMELNKIFFELLRNFDFQLLNPEKPWDSASYWVPVESNMWMKVTEAN
ncbi:cytochrome P450 [Stachybotrys elegans]|uniref:Cytochrome P450 n=1 Tax=Stachybotrys elegans TaxID=80388 RepID=A0A8K0SGU8_9HYPO|nr:cytochrome P450 [Stachybotrys elegans]